MVRSYRTAVRRQVEVGKIYGRLTVVSFAGRNKNGNLLWDCRCACGNRKQVFGSNLLGGSNQSCGCYKKEILLLRNTTHGMAGTPEYLSWQGMRQRCNNRDNENWPSYGGRGIKICSRWDDFAAFLEDMGLMSVSGSTIERKDNDGDYCPGNCIWASRKVQSRNKRNIPLVEYGGELKSVAEWAEKFSIHPETLRKRIQLGWPMVKALSAPPRPIKGVHY